MNSEQKYDDMFDPIMSRLEEMAAFLVETGDLNGLKILNGKVAICMMLAVRLIQDQQQQEGHC
jgi:hypothetical protein